MSTNQTQIERDALLWWDNLYFETRAKFKLLYFPNQVGMNNANILFIYKAEHPSIPVVESTEDKEPGSTKGEWQIELIQDDEGKYYKIGPVDFYFHKLNTLEEHTKALEIAKLIASAPKLKEQNEIILQQIESLNEVYKELKIENSDLKKHANYIEKDNEKLREGLNTIVNLKHMAGASRSYIAEILSTAKSALEQTKQ